ncbi:MAG: anthranilate synthase component I family protein [Pseudomonadota bacterium]
MKSPFDIAGDLDTPVSAYAKLASFRPRFLLESVEGGERLGRYSFIGFGSGLEVRLDSHALTIGPNTYPVPTSREVLLERLREALARAPRPQPELPGLPLAGGLVGFTAFDVVRFFERLPMRLARKPNAPVLHYIAPESLLVFDHLTRAIALLHAGTEAERRVLREEVIAALRGRIVLPRAAGAFSEPTMSLGRDDYMAGVRATQEYIASGDVYQLVLSSKFSGTHQLDPFQVYRALRMINPSPYMYHCSLGGVTVVGSSPEALVKLHKGVAELRPIAGTLPRMADPEADLANEKRLLADPKENAEHVMLVDLARNDLGRVAAAGSVHVNPYRAIERYSHVMHIVSGVKGKLAEEKDAFDLFAATFPAGTLVGAPKVRAMQLIEELEPVDRGLYGGTIGYFGAQGDMDQAITIRTLVFEGDQYSYQAGAGIVSDSQPEMEFNEILAKSAALRSALTLAQEGL